MDKMDRHQDTYIDQSIFCSVLLLPHEELSAIIVLISKTTPSKTLNILFCPFKNKKATTAFMNSHFSTFQAESRSR